MINPLTVTSPEYYRELHLCNLPNTPLRAMLNLRDTIRSLLPVKRAGWLLMGFSQGVKKECKEVLA